MKLSQSLIFWPKIQRGDIVHLLLMVTLWASKLFLHSLLKEKKWCVEKCNIQLISVLNLISKLEFEKNFETKIAENCRKPISLLRLYVWMRPKIDFWEYSFGKYTLLKWSKNCPISLLITICKLDYCLEDFLRNLCLNFYWNSMTLQTWSQHWYFDGPHADYLKLTISHWAVNELCCKENK